MDDLPLSPCPDLCTVHHHPVAHFVLRLTRANGLNDCEALVPRDKYHIVWVVGESNAWPRLLRVFAFYHVQLVGVMDGQNMEELEGQENIRPQGVLGSIMPEFVHRILLAVGAARARCGIPAPALDRPVWRRLSLENMLRCTF